MKLHFVELNITNLRSEDFMKNQKSKFTKKLFAVIITLVMICGISYAKPASINSKLLIGTWFWSYGYNQENFSKDEITFNKDKTVEIMSINSNYTEYDKGVYEYQFKLY